jgi:hypothetical protein
MHDRKEHAMKTVTPAAGLGRRALVLSILVGGLCAALLALAADQARAAYTARVDSGTLKIIGNADSDRLVLRLQDGSPGTLEVDVGADGTADFNFDRSTFTTIDVRAKGGDDEGSHRSEQRLVHRRADHPRRW